MDPKYSSQILIDIMKPDKGSQVITNLARRAIKNGIPFEYLNLSSPERFYDTVDFYTHINSNSFFPGSVAFCVNEHGKVLRASKDLLNNSIKNETFNNLVEMEKATLNQRIDILKKADHNSRIYVFGHGTPGGNFMTSSCGTRRTDYDQLSDIIKLNPALCDYSNKPVKISLISCYGAVDGIYSKSFAHKLSKSLASRGVYAKVSGKNHLVSIPDDLTSPFQKLTNGIHHWEKGKIYFETDPVTNNTITRFAIYKNNIDSLIKPYDEILKNYTGAYNFKSEEAKLKLSQIAYDIVIESNLYKHLPENELEKLNRMRWNKECCISPIQLFNYAKNTLDTYIYACLSKYNSLFDHKEGQLNDILNPYPSETSDVLKRLYDFKDVLIEDIKEKSKSVNSNTLEKIDAYSADFESSSNINNASFYKKKALTLGIYKLMKKYEVLTSMKLRSYGKVHPSIDKPLEVFKSFEKSHLKQATAKQNLSCTDGIRKREISYFYRDNKYQTNKNLISMNTFN